MNRDEVLARIQRSGGYLRTVAREFGGDREIVRIAALRCATTLRHATWTLRDDAEFVRSIVAHNADALKFASPAVARRSRHRTFGHAVSSYGASVRVCHHAQGS